MDLQDKNAVVIGGVSGIGLACVKELLKNGVKKVVIIDYNDGAFPHIIKEISDEFGLSRINIYKADISKETELEETFKKVVKHLEVVHILHCNAAICVSDIWRTVYAINLLGITQALHLGLDHMSKEKGGQGGTIILTSSSMALSAFPFMTIYSASKWALLGLTIGYGHCDNFERTGVSVMAMCPGATNTPLLHGDNLYSKNSVRNHPDLKEYYRIYRGQDPSRVAQGVIYMLKSGTSGSVYYTEHGKTYEVEMPDLEKSTHKLKQVL